MRNWLTPLAPIRAAMVRVRCNMLTRFARYRETHKVCPEAEVALVCASAEQLPLADNSVDLVISSSVFLHMGKSFLLSTLERMGRMLKPGGAIAFDTSFPNRRSISLLPIRLDGLVAPDKPNRSKYYTRSEIAALLRDTGIVGKCGPITIGATEFALVPPLIRRVQVLLAARLNALLSPPPRVLEDLVAMIYSAGAPSTSPTVVGASDFIGNPRSAGAAIDLGAFEVVP